MHAWVNGRLLDDPGAPSVTVRDHGFTVGDGVFEAVKVVGGQPFALTPPTARMGRPTPAPPRGLSPSREGRGRPRAWASPSCPPPTYGPASRRSWRQSTCRSVG